MLDSMCIKMSEGIVEERSRWVKPIVDGKIKLKDIALVCPYGKRTLERWVANYKKDGLSGLEPKSTRPRTSPKEAPIKTKGRVLELRRESNLCALKLSYKLRKEGINLNHRTIGKYIKQEGLTRRYRTKKITYNYVKAPLRTGELVEIDIKYVPGRVRSGRYYQYTAIDCATRWRYLAIYESPSNTDALRFLRELIKVAPFKIRAIKTDNGPCFTNRYLGYLKSTDPHNPRLHPFDIECQRLNIIHYLIDPGKPAQNGKVERSHRTDQEHFYDRMKFKNLDELKYQLKLWNVYYNNLEHIALDGRTPNEVLKTAV